MAELDGPSIRETLDSLAEEAKRRIMYANNYEIVHFESVGSGKFIGVHISDTDRRFRIHKRAGNWAVGELV